MKTGIVVFIAVFQSVLLAAHFFVYETWLHLWNPGAVSWLAGSTAVVFLLGVSFVAASLLSFKYWNGVTRVFYRTSAVWLGLFNFLFLAAVGSLVKRKAAKGMGLSGGGTGPDGRRLCRSRCSMVRGRGATR